MMQVISQVSPNCSKHLSLVVLYDSLWIIKLICKQRGVSCLLLNSISYLMRRAARNYEKIIYVCLSSHTGGLLPTVLLPGTLEDTGRFTTLQSLHGAAKDWLQRSQWERHPAHTTMVLTSPSVCLRELDQGLLRPYSTKCYVSIMGAKTYKWLVILHTVILLLQTNILIWQ